MIKPDTLKIFGHTYEVLWESGLIQEEKTVAVCIPNTLKIKADTSFKESRQEEGLIHEIIEALNYHMQMDLPHEKISQLGEGLYQVLKDNNLLQKNIKKPVVTPKECAGCISWDLW